MSTYNFLILKHNNHQPAGAKWPVVLCRGASAGAGISYLRDNPATTMIIVNDWRKKFPEELITEERLTVNFLTDMAGRQFVFGNVEPKPIEMRCRRAWDEIVTGKLKANKEKFEALRHLWNENPDTGLRAIAWTSLTYGSMIIYGFDVWDSDYYGTPMSMNIEKKIKKGLKRRDKWLEALDVWIRLTPEVAYLFYTASEHLPTRITNHLNVDFKIIR